LQTILKDANVANAGRPAISYEYFKFFTQFSSILQKYMNNATHSRSQAKMQKKRYEKDHIRKFKYILRIFLKTNNIITSSFTFNRE